MEYCGTTSVYKGDKADSNNFRGTNSNNNNNNYYYYYYYYY